MALERLRDDKHKVTGRPFEFDNLRSTLKVNNTLKTITYANFCREEPLYCIVHTCTVQLDVVLSYMIAFSREWRERDISILSGRARVLELVWTTSDAVS